jgi:hypothetical protein
MIGVALILPDAKISSITLVIISDFVELSAIWLFG